MAQPWNLGPPLLDFSPIGNLGKTYQQAVDAGVKRDTEQQRRQVLASLGQGGDYNKVGQALIGLGEIQEGAAIIGLGQKTEDRKLELEAYKNSPFSSGATIGVPTGLPASTAPAGGGTSSLIQDESGGRWTAQNDAVGAGGKVGHFGRLQFGQARLEEAAAAGAIPPGTSPQQFMQSPELQKRAEQWHFNDIDQSIKANGLDRMIGKSINGVPVTLEGMRAVAHLGGKQGLAKFMISGGKYNPADRNGTRLSDYFARHGGETVPAPTAVASAPLPPPQGVQVAETEADVQRLEQEQAARAAAPVQVAQAAPQPGAPVSDAANVPAPGAAPAQGFMVPPGDAGALPPNDPYPQVTNQQLINVLRNPRSSAGDKTLAQQIFASRQAYSAENAPDKRAMTRAQTEKAQLEAEKLRREVQGEGARPMTPEERAAYNVAPNQPAYITRTGDPKFGPVGTTVNNSNTFDGKGENKFNEALGAAQAKRWNGYIEEGDVAQNRLADIQTLRDASRRLGSQGSSANLKSTIGPYAESLGIKIEGLSDIQLYESITNRLAPSLRAPGSGSTSDIEFKGFMRAIGPLSNTPAAREMILDTFEAASRNDIARSEIASRLAAGEINRGQAEKEIRSLANPLEGFRKFREANPDIVGDALKESLRRAGAEKRDPVKVMTPEEAKKLPSGTRIILPDGRQGQVP